MKPTSTTKKLVISDDDTPRLIQFDFHRIGFRIGDKPASKQERQAAVRARV